MHNKFCETFILNVMNYIAKLLITFSNTIYLQSRRQCTYSEYTVEWLPTITSINRAILCHNRVKRTGHYSLYMEFLVYYFPE